MGIDLLRVGRVRRFLRQYGPQVFEKILTPLERTWVQGRRSNAVEFARRFCAKEAYFKTLDAPWLGVEGLQKIHIEAMTKHTFKALWLDEKGEASREASGCFFQGPRWVAAQVIRWQ